MYFRVSAVDADGTLVADAADTLSFGLSGLGRIIAVGNGDARGYESFCDVSSHPLYCGRAVVIVKRTGQGEISLSAVKCPLNGER